MKILILAAHPDDEILGIGGTVIHHIERGDTAEVCIVTKAYKPQWSQEYMDKKIQEQKEVDALLGISKRYNLDLPTVKLNTIPTGEFNSKITEVIQESNPDIVYTHCEHDLNCDHTLIFRAAMVATRPPSNIKLYCYETLSESEWSNNEFKPNTWVALNEEQLNKKIEAFKIYASEVKKFPHPRSPEGIKILAKKRGSEICSPLAEAFTVIRNYEV